MTIREHFQRLYKRTTYTVISGAFGVILLIDWLYPQLTRFQHLWLGFLLGIPFSIVLLLLSGRWFVCPRCGVAYHKMRRRPRIEIVTDRRLYWDRWDACPNCGISFTDPMPNNPVS